MDEAQNIPMETLEQLRMLSNFETSRKKLLQIILIGQPELDRLLNKKALRQLRQRIAVRAVITHLTAAETRAYIEHRTAIAGGDSSELFSPKGLKAIIHHAQGAPRTVNILCANALITCIGYGRHKVDAEIVKEVVEDLGLNRGGHPGFFPLRFAIASVVTVLLGIASAYVAHDMLTASIPATSEHIGQPSQITLPEDSVRHSQKEIPDRHTNGTSSMPKPPPEAKPGRDNTKETQRYHTDRISPTQQLSTQASTNAARPTAVKDTGLRYLLRKVQRGDYLTRMSIEVYGEATENTLTRLQKANPQIEDPNLIFEGDVLRFPR